MSSHRRSNSTCTSHSTRKTTRVPNTRCLIQHLAARSRREMFKVMHGRHPSHPLLFDVRSRRTAHKVRNKRCSFTPSLHHLFRDPHRKRQGGTDHQFAPAHSEGWSSTVHRLGTTVDTRESLFNAPNWNQLEQFQCCAPWENLPLENDGVSTKF